MNIIANGVTKLAPSSFTAYEAVLNTQQKSAERNAKGVLVREPLPDKWSLKLEWEFATPEEFYAWFSYIKGLTQINFTVSFPAPTGLVETATFYISPISSKMLSLSRGATGWWRTLGCSFIEV